MIVFGIMGGLVTAYVLWLVVRGTPPPQSGWINGWAEDAFYLAAGVVCVIGGLRWRAGSYAPLVFGLALICTTTGNTILTVYALRRTAGDWAPASRWIKLVDSSDLGTNPPTAPPSSHHLAGVVEGQ